MAIFAYRALTTAGRTLSGVIDADSQRAAWQELRARGVYPTDLETRPTGIRDGARVAAAELAATTRELAALVEAGVPLAEALVTAAESATSATLARALTLAHAKVREGEPLAAALAESPRVFPPLYRELVHAGEASGALGATLDRLAAHTEASAALTARLRAALTYPAVMTLATVSVLTFLLTWVVPQVTRLFRDTGAVLPLPTRILVAITDAVGAVWWLLVLALLAAGFGFRAWAARPTSRARLDAVLLRLPVVGALARKAASARLARTLATLLAGGMPLEPALGVAGAAVGNRALGAAVAAIREGVRQGQPLARALVASGEFPPLLVQLAATGERGGTLATTLERAATAYEGEVEAAVTTATALLEPMLIIVMGMVVLALVMAILLPLFSLDQLVH
jgi:general secretion pathway protein F